MEWNGLNLDLFKLFCTLYDCSLSSHRHVYLIPNFPDFYVDSDGQKMWNKLKQDVNIVEQIVSGLTAESRIYDNIPSEYHKLAWWIYSLPQCFGKYMKIDGGDIGFPRSLVFSYERDNDPIIVDSKTAFHGSDCSNWLSILFNGLIPLSNSKHQLHGSVYGSGIYLSDQYSVSREYSRYSPNIVAMVDIHKDHVKNPHYVIDTAGAIRLRYLILS